MGEKQVFVIDIGASKVSASLAICARANKIFEIFTEFARRRITSGSHIQYISDLSEIILSMKTTLEMKANSRLKDVFLNIDSEFVNCRLSRAAAILAGDSSCSVSSLALRRLQRQARSLGLKLDEAILHEFPAQYIIDSNISTGNPLGILARKLEIDLNLLTCKTIGIDYLVKIVTSCGLKLKKIAFSGIASAAAILNSKEKLQNAVVIDIGASTTKIVGFQNGVLKSIKVIPFAGNNITEAIAASLKLSFELAEELKKTYASVATDALQAGEDIIVKTRNAYKIIKRSQVSKAVVGKVEKLIFSIRDYLDSASLEEPRIFVCGGAALLDGFLESLENRISAPVVLGRPNVEYLPVQKRNNFFKNPAQATMLGLLLLALDWDILLPQSSKPSRMEFFGHIIQKAKHIYYDYF